MRNAVLSLTLAASLLAVPRLVSAQDSDPPSRVARIAYLNGSVSYEPASVDTWGDAPLNYPMTTGDNLYTDDGARAVLRIGQNSIRLNSDTNFQFVNLSDNVVQTSVNSGGLSLRVRRLFDDDSWEIDTPNGAITVLRTGEYRVDTDPNRNATMVTVHSGDVEVTANDQSFPIHSGQSAYFDSSGNPPDVQDASQADDFDNFAASRDQMEDVPPPQYVSPDMDGYEDLNGNGDWQNTSDYGPVWTPRVDTGWTPYHQGHWAWVDPWGWTWVDDEPWGFAPFHYGRWVYLSNHWGWCPGAVSTRVYYAPALVAFVGGGFAGGRGDVVGWFPLGPREPYYPTYHVSETYIRQVNATNTRITNISVTNINVTNINYVNRNALVAMPQSSFTSAQPVQRAAVRIDPNQMRQAQVIGSAPRVAPQRASVVAVSSGRASAPPAAILARAVVAKRTPPPAAVPFAARQQMLQAHPGTPLAPTQLQSLRSQPAVASQRARRAPIQTINAAQVHAVTPTVRPGPAPTLARHPAAQPAAAGRPVNQPARSEPAPVGRTQNPVPATGHEQVQPAFRQPPAPQPPRPQPQPPVRPEVQQPNPPQPNVRERVAPTPNRPEPNVRERVQPQPQPAPPPNRPQPPVRQKVQPPARSTPPPRENPHPQVNPPPAQHNVPPPKRQPPPKKDDKQKDDQRKEDRPQG